MNAVIIPPIINSDQIRAIAAAAHERAGDDRLTVEDFETATSAYLNSWLEQAVTVALKGGFDVSLRCAARNVAQVRVMREYVKEVA